jgi:hypothetical protein
MLTHPLRHHGFLQQLKAFHAGLGLHQREPGDVAAGPGEARHMAGLEGSRVAHEYDGDGRGCGFGCACVDRAWGHYDINLKADQFRRQFAHTFWFSLCSAVLNGDVPTLNVAEVLQPLAEGFKGIGKYGWTVPQKADANRPFPLRPRRERPRDHRAAEERYELAPLQIGQRPLPSLQCRWGQDGGRVPSVCRALAYRGMTGRSFGQT